MEDSVVVIGAVTEEGVRIGEDRSVVLGLSILNKTSERHLNDTKLKLDRTHLHLMILS